MAAWMLAMSCWLMVTVVTFCTRKMRRKSAAALRTGANAKDPTTTAAAAARTA